MNKGSVLNKELGFSIEQVVSAEQNSGVSNEQGSQLNKEPGVSNQQKVLTEQGVRGL